MLKVEFIYNALGNRDMKKVYENGSSTPSSETRFLYDGWDPAKAGSTGNSRWDIWADENIEMGSITTLGVRYLHGPGVDQTFARTVNGNAFWLIHDRLRSIRGVLDNTGAIKDTITYDGFGKILTQSDSSFLGRFAYTNREWDVEIALQYNRARYYDPSTARWISQDPLGFDAGDSNLYRYVNNRATWATDPSGLQPDGRIASSFADEPRSSWFEVDNVVVSRDLTFRLGKQSRHSISLEFQERRDPKSGVKITYTGPHPEKVKMFQVYSMSIIAYFENEKKGFIEGGFPVIPDGKNTTMEGYFGFAESKNGRPWMLDAPTEHRNDWRYYTDPRAVNTETGAGLNGRGDDTVWIKDRPSLQYMIFGPWAKIELGAMLTTAKANSAMCIAQFQTFIEYDGVVIAEARWRATGIWEPSRDPRGKYSNAGCELFEVSLIDPDRAKGFQQMVRNTERQRPKITHAPGLISDQLRKIRDD